MIFVIFLFYFTVFSLWRCRLSTHVRQRLKAEFHGRIDAVSKLTDKVWIVSFTPRCPSSPGCVNDNPTLVAPGVNLRYTDVISGQETRIKYVVYGSLWPRKGSTPKNVVKLCRTDVTHVAVLCLYVDLDCRDSQ